MAINKVNFNGKTLIDLTNDTVTADTLIAGTIAHAANGERIVGTFDPSIYVKKASKKLTSANDLNTIQGFQSFEWSTSTPKNAPETGLRNCSGVSFGDSYTAQLVSTSTGKLWYRIKGGTWHQVTVWGA